MKKKLFSIIMCVLMVMCFMPTATFADVQVGGDSTATGEQLTETQPTAEDTSSVTLPEDITEDSFTGGSTVYYAGTYYTADSSKGALELAIDAANTDNSSEVAKIYIKPKATNSNKELVRQAHQGIKTSIAIYGNGASLGNRWEPCVEYSATGYHVLTKDISIEMYDLNDGAGVWGMRTSAYTVDVTMKNCKNVHELLLNGQNDGGTNNRTNYTIENCTFDSTKYADACPVTTTNAGDVILRNCTFTDINTNYPVGINNKNGGTTNVTIEDCTFINCGSRSNGKQTVRLVGEAEGSSVVATLSNLTFRGSEENSESNGYDIVIGKGNVDENMADVSYTISGTKATLTTYIKGKTTAITMGLDADKNYTGNNKTLNITNGTFDDLSVLDYLADGYVIVGNADGTWSVKKPGTSEDGTKVEVETKEDGTQTVTETTTGKTTTTETKKVNGATTTTTTVTTNPVKDKVAGTTTATTTEVVVTKNADGAEVKTTTETKEVTKKTDTVATTEKTVTKKASDGSETVAVTKIVEDKGNNVAVTTTVKDNTAKVKAKIAENKTVTTKSVTVDATAATADAKEVKAAEVTLPATTVKALNEIVNSDTATRKVESVELKTDVATLEIDRTALKTLTANADKSKALVLSVEEKEPTTEEATEKDGKKVTTKFELTATVDGKNVFDSTGTNNGTITVKVPYTPAKNSSVKVFYVPESGEQVDMNATYKDGYVSWETNHFSLYDFVEEKGEITISVTNAEDATSKISTTPGKEVKFNVKLDDNTKGITGLQLDLVYNDKVLTLQKVDYTGCIFESYLDPDESTDAEEANYNVLSFGNTEGNVGTTGLLATLTFKVAEDAQTGSYDIELVCDDGGDGNVTTVSGSGATATINNAEVVISSYGDVDGDGDVDLSDIMQLRRHVAKWGGYAKLKNLEAGDLNGDGKYTLRDVQILTYYNAGDYEGYKTLPYKKASQTA